MRLDPDRRIAGYRHIEIRNFLRDLESYGHEEAGRRHLNGDGNLQEMIPALEGEGLISWGTEGALGAHDEPGWMLTDLGRRFCLAKAIKPVDRGKADRIVFDMLNRVKRAIDDDGQLFEVERPFLFGSYIRDTGDCGDIDACFDRRPKAKFNGGRSWPTGEEFKRHHRALMAADRYRPRNMIDELFYAQRKLKSAIKGGIKEISMHEIEDLKSTDYPFMIAYEAPGAEPLDWERLKGSAPLYFDVAALARRMAK